MSTIILEGVLFVALIVTAATLVSLAVRSLTPFGKTLRQTQNRRRIERDAEHTCPRHGMHPEEALVRLPDGELVCPECYKEIVHGKLD
jgi:hypothetical protein